MSERGALALVIQHRRSQPRHTDQHQSLPMVGEERRTRQFLSLLTNPGVGNTARNDNRGTKKWDRKRCVLFCPIFLSTTFSGRGIYKKRSQYTDQTSTLS